jgi:hypothetical protein
VVVTLFLDCKLNADLHFKFVEKKEVRVIVQGSSKYIKFNEPETLIYVRLKTIHQHYLNHQRSAGQKALDYATLVSYIKTKDYYVGRVGAEKFKNVEKSKASFILRYDYLGVPLQPGDREISTD